MADLTHPVRMVKQKGQGPARPAGGARSRSPEAPDRYQGSDLAGVPGSSKGRAVRTGSRSPVAGGSRQGSADLAAGCEADKANKLRADVSARMKAALQELQQTQAAADALAARREQVAAQVRQSLELEVGNAIRSKDLRSLLQRLHVISVHDRSSDLKKALQKAKHVA
eukprot:gene5798-6038_t